MASTDAALADRRLASVDAVTAPTIRVPTPADADAWWALFDDPEVMRFVGAGEVRDRAYYGDLVARQQALAASTGHLFAFARTDEGRPEVVTLATRLAIGLDRLGGWAGHTVALPEGRWRDVLCGRVVDGGVQPIAPLLDKLPVALFVRHEEA